MQQIQVTTPHGVHRAAFASGFLDRLFGIRRIGDADLVIIPGRSVHGLGLDAPLEVAGLSPFGVITGVAMLRPLGLRRFPGASHVLESPPGSVPLHPGDRIAMEDRNR